MTRSQLLSATALAGTAGPTLVSPPAAAAYEPEVSDRKRAQSCACCAGSGSCKAMRISGWPTRAFTQLTGAPARVDSKNFEDIRPKAAHGVIGALAGKLAIGLTRIDMIEPDASAVVLDQHARPIALTETRRATLIDIRRPSVMSARF